MGDVVTSLHGDRIGLDRNDYLTGKGFQGVSFGNKGAEFQYRNLREAIVLFDDFLGDTLDARWSGAAGNDAQAVAPTINAQVGGVVRMTTGDTVTVSESAISLTHGLNWKASLGGLVFEAKVKPVSSVANVAYFIGLTDVLATTTLEEPITLSGTTFTTNASDAVGFVFDTAATTDVIYGKGVKADTDSATLTHTAGFVADTSIVLRIEVDTSGNASLYIDGVLLGTITDAVTPGTALTPVVEIMARTTTSKSIDVDYIYVSQDRA